MKKEMTYEQIFATSRDKMEEIMKEVREKCKNDKMFEQNFISNPTETLKKEGLELQKGISFQIVKTEEEANLLPDNVVPLSFDNKKDSLSLEELDKVAGGESCNNIWHEGEHTHQLLVRDSSGELQYGGKKSYTGGGGGS